MRLKDCVKRVDPVSGTARGRGENRVPDDKSEQSEEIGTSLWKSGVNWVLA